MEKAKINKAADILYSSRINIKRIKSLPKDCTPISFQEAYAIQDELTKRYLSEDKKTLLIGKKIGCTNEDAKNQLNIKDSFFGNIFSNNISKSNTVINPNKYFSPFVEPEFSFIMKNELDISKAPYNFNTVFLEETYYECIHDYLTTYINPNTGMLFGWGTYNGIKCALKKIWEWRPKSDVVTRGICPRSFNSALDKTIRKIQSLNESDQKVGIRNDVDMAQEGITFNQYQELCDYFIKKNQINC